ncbi:MAG TPA: SRPBCC family protein [Chthonomonadaceae bacterium]|nr:SRPBCC family protein [Chthonomonadaceae bacterium]
MPRIEQSVTIQAPIDHVYGIAKNVEAFPQFMEDLQSLNLLERSDDGARTVTEWVGIIREFRMTVKWVQEDRWNDATHRDEFTMLRGDMDRMEGFWQFTAGGGATRFDSLVDYEYNVPLIGAMVKALIKKKMTDNLQATMDAIKRQAEASADSTG